MGDNPGPQGLSARVTNLANGRSAVVTIRDRGPHARGRIVDVSPRIADERRMRDAGVTRVVLQPISVPDAGSRRRGQADKSLTGRSWAAIINHPGNSFVRVHISVLRSEFVMR
jgi:rare lipoprotein A